MLIFAYEGKIALAMEVSSARWFQERFVNLLVPKLTTATNALSLLLLEASDSVVPLNVQTMFLKSKGIY